MLHNSDGVEVAGALTNSIVVNDPAAMREAARLGLGVALIALFDVLPELERGDLIRLLPNWYADAGAISLYYASRTLISAKTRVFVDFVVNAFKNQRLDLRFAGRLG
jgi:DNA-binding transcriptional LysR family regulator